MARRYLWTYGLTVLVVAWVWFAFLSPIFVENWTALTAEQIEDRCGWSDRQLQRECRDHYVRVNQQMQKLLSR